MGKKYLTIDDLLLFCKQSNMHNFSAKEAGGPIIVQSFGEAELTETQTYGLTSCTLHACHTELNRNHSFIEKDVMEKALGSFANRPILGFTHQLSDGSWDFWDHRMEIEEDGDDTRVEYLERPIGIIPESCNAHLEYNKDKDKTYVVVNGYLYDDYGNRAVDIIKGNNGQVDVSVEIAINAMSFNAKENYLNIEDFTFMGVTCLGKTPDGDIVQPGMEGSNLKLNNFSKQENSMFANQDKLIETLEKLNFTLESFNKEKNVEDKGGERDMSKLEELLAKYGKTAEEISFDVEGLSDTELEAKFNEEFGNTDDSNTSDEGGNDLSVSNEGDGDEPVATEAEVCGGKKKKCSEDNNEDPEGESVATEEEACGKKKKCDEEEPEVKEEEACGKKKKCSIDDNGNMSVNFEISHDDIRCALYNLVEEYDELDNEFYFIRSVYNGYFIMQGYTSNKLYKQNYTIDGDNVALDGERQEVFEMILTESEKIAIDKMREDYSVLENKYNELKAFKDNYDASQLKAQKDAILASEEYSVLTDDEAFKALVSEIEKYSVDELKVQADLVFAAYAKKQVAFAAKQVEEKKTGKIGFNFAIEHDEEYAPYGSILPAKKKTKK